MAFLMTQMMSILVFEFTYFIYKYGFLKNNNMLFKFLLWLKGLFVELVVQREDSEGSSEEED